MPCLEEADFDDGEDSKKNKRGKTRFLIREQRELVTYPSAWLAEKYEYKAYYGQELFKIRRDIKQLIKDDIDDVAAKTGDCERKFRCKTVAVSSYIYGCIFTGQGV